MGDSVTITVPSEPQRPEWLPEKFKSPEDLAKAYAELEGKLSSGAKPEDKTPDEKKAEAAPKGEVKDLTSPLAKAAAEIDTNGFLSEATVTVLKEKGIPLQDVKAYLNGKKSEVALMSTELAKVVGTAEELEATIKWAKTNVDADTVAAYDDAVAQGKTSVAAALLAGIALKRGKEPKLLSGAAPPSGVEGFKSQAEMIRAMQDPRYATDPAYRDLVEQKLINATF